MRQIPVRDVEDRLAHDGHRVEIGWSKVHPALIDEHPIGEIDDAVAVQTIAPPIDEIPGAVIQLETDETQVVNSAHADDPLGRTEVIVNRLGEVRRQHGLMACQCLFEPIKTVVHQNIRIEVKDTGEADDVAQVFEDKRLDGGIQLQDIVAEGKTVKLRNSEVLGENDLERKIIIGNAVTEPIDEADKDSRTRMVLEVGVGKDPRHPEVIVRRDRKGVYCHGRHGYRDVPFNREENSRLTARPFPGTIGDASLGTGTVKGRLKMDGPADPQPATPSAAEESASTSKPVPRPTILQRILTALVAPFRQAIVGSLEEEQRQITRNLHENGMRLEHLEQLPQRLNENLTRTARLEHLVESLGQNLTRMARLESLVEEQTRFAEKLKSMQAAVTTHIEALENAKNAANEDIKVLREDAKRTRDHLAALQNQSSEHQNTIARLADRGDRFEELWADLHRDMTAIADALSREESG